MLKLVDPWVWPFVVVSSIFAALEAFAHDWMEHVLGAHVATVLVEISLAIIAAFIFYLLVDVNRRWRDIRAIAPYVTQQIKTMKGDILAIVREAAIVHGKALPEDWEFESSDVERLFKLVGPNSSVKSLVLMTGQPASFIDFFADRQKSTEAATSNLSKHYSTLGPEGMVLVTLVHDTSYARTLKAIIRMRVIQNSTLEVFAKLLIDHNEQVEKLVSWAKAKGFYAA